MSKEVAMRLKFESKLNHLHCLYREMQTRYERAVEDIDKFSTHNSDLIKLSDKQRGIISELSNQKTKLETDVEFKQSQIKLYLRENDK